MGSEMAKIVAQLSGSDGSEILKVEKSVEKPGQTTYLQNLTQNLRDLQKESNQTLTKIIEQSKSNGKIEEPDDIEEDSDSSDSDQNPSERCSTANS